MGQKENAIKLIILFGIISLLGDLLYEGARSVNGPYLKTLGINSVIVGLIVGIGELLGYTLRLFSGYFSDKTKNYWLFTIIGYGLLISVPLLSLIEIWQSAAFFIILERIGKALRSPSKDTILSYATKQVGRGFGFSIHEFFDQLGGVIGPLIFTFFFFSLNTTENSIKDYQNGYSLLWIPFIFLMIILIMTYIMMKNPQEFETSPSNFKTSEEFKYNARIFWMYIIFTSITTIGFVSFVLIGYHIKTNNIVPEGYIPIFYAIAMFMDGILALIIGKYYDDLKTKNKNEYSGIFLLIIIPVLSAIIPLFIFSFNYIFIFIGMIFWGIVMGIHETIMKSVIADITPVNKRGFSYGIFNTFYGLSMFLGSLLVGLLYNFSIQILSVILFNIQIIGIIYFIYFYRFIRINY